MTGGRGPAGADWRAARSWLFVPGTRPDRFDKAASAADVAILDLEDAVAPGDRPVARRAVADWLNSGRRAWVRVNGPGSEACQEDVAVLTARAGKGLSGIVVPKAENGDDLARVAAAVDAPVVALVETAVGVENIGDIVRVPRVVALALGTADMALDVGLGGDPQTWAYVRGRLVIASRAAGLRAPIDGPTMNLGTTTATAVDAGRAAADGFGGKLCIHPRQVPAVDSAFGRSADEVAWARRVTAAARDHGDAVFLVDGAMVDRPVLELARVILAEAGADQ